MKTKTRKTIAKRVRLTKQGKLLVRRRTTQHLIARVSKRATKQSGKLIKASKSMAKGIRKLLPYG